MLYFFLSHAAGDDEDYVRRFYHDLSDEVGRLAEVDGQVGFLDVARQESGRWPNAADDAVGSCRVFVALCSPRYFLSRRCGREWSTFADRLYRYQQATGAVVAALIPIMWTNVDAPRQLIEGAGEPALVPHSPGGAGLRQLIRLHSWRSAYREFVATLARRIVDTAAAHPVPPALPGPDLATAPNAFDAEAGPRPGAEPPAPDQARVPPTQRVHFVVAAGTRDEMGAVRGDVRFYGAAREDWAPYRPALPEPLAARARSVAAERLFGSNIADLEGLPDCIERARHNNDIVVLLVDAWVTKFEAHRSALVEFDGSGEVSIAVLVPASREDAETVRHQGELKSEVWQTFHHTAARHDQMFRTEIDTVGGFDNDLMAVLEEAQNRIYSKGRVFRRPADAPAVDRPILDGP